MTLAVDHVMVLAGDLDAAAAWMLDSHGLASVEGGQHTGHGTGNRIVPLGEAYVELLSVVDLDEAGESPFGRWVLANLRPEPFPAALCLRTTDADAVATRLGLEPVAMSRLRPDGTRLAWRLVAYELMMSDGLPFFVEWACPPEDHPGAARAAHRAEPTGTVHVTLSGNPEVLRRHLGDDDLPIDIVAGAAGVERVVIGTRQGAVILP